MNTRGALLMLGFAGLISSTAATEVNSASCTPQPFRFDDDCQNLASSELPLRGTDRLRYIPLSADGSVWLTVGGEYRLKVETLDRPDFGVASPDKAFTAVGQRFLLDADLRSIAGWRLFLQVSDATDTGRKPTERPFDRSEPDMAQAFTEIPIRFDNIAGALRLGREELDLGGTRLVSVREVANLRLSFDMAHLQIRTPIGDLTAFWGRPVVIQKGALDDSAPPSERFYGMRIEERPLVFGEAVALDLLTLGRDRDRAVFADAAGPEHRRLLGLRAAGNSGHVDYILAASYEFGRNGDLDIAAHALAATLGYRWADMPWQPRLGVDMGLATGNKRKGGGRLTSFDPLYPNLGYFNDAQINYPLNWQGFEPSLTIAPAVAVELKVGADFQYRQSKADGVYDSSGRAFIPGGAPGSDYVDTQAFASIGWHLSEHVQLNAEYVHGFAGSVVKSAHGRDLDYGNVYGSYRF